jgi:hypothetical protein
MGDCHKTATKLQSSGLGSDGTGRAGMLIRYGEFAP